jgi:DNA (cytosine-5)-methyltransferase 1
MEDQLNELALFAGAGGGILGGKLLGWRTVCAVEVNTFCARRLMQRQNEGHLPPFPIWDDVRTFDGHPWQGVVDVVSGGFPCQDISAAGTGNGIDGERSGLWLEMARIIGEVRPRFAFVENSPMLTSRGLGTVLGDLASMGYDAEWGVLGAADVGANHQRDRIWIVAYRDCLRKLQSKRFEQEQRGRIGDGGGILADSNEIGRRRRAGMFGQGGRIEPKNGCNEMADADCQRLKKQHLATISSETRQHLWGAAAYGRENWWATEPGVGRVAHGVASRVDRLQALGNGQVPQCHAEAWQRLILRGS